MEKARMNTSIHEMIVWKIVSSFQNISMVWCMQTIMIQQTKRVYVLNTHILSKDIFPFQGVKNSELIYPYATIPFIHSQAISHGFLLRKIADEVNLSQSSLNIIAI